MSADARRQQRRMIRRGGVPLLLALISGALALVVIPVATLFLLDLNGSMIAAIEPVIGGIGGAGPGDIISGVGRAWSIFAVSVLAVPAALILAALLGGDSGGGGPERPPGGPPF